MTFHLFEEGGAKRNGEHICFGERFLFSKINPYGIFVNMNLLKKLFIFPDIRREMLWNCDICILFR